MSACAARASGTNASNRAGRQRQGPLREERGDHRGSQPEPAQPTAHRRRRHPQPLSDPPMTTPSHVRDQCTTDHLDLITTPHQQHLRQQHVRARTTNTTRSPRLHPPLHPTHRPHIPTPRLTPRRQPIITARTPQPARQQLDLDPDRVATYHEHRCLRHHSARAPSSNCQEERGGPCAYRHPHPDASKSPPPTPTPNDSSSPPTTQPTPPSSRVHRPRRPLPRTLTRTWWRTGGPAHLGRSCRGPRCCHAADDVLVAVAGVSDRSTGWCWYTTPVTSLASSSHLSRAGRAGVSGRRRPRRRSCGRRQGTACIRRPCRCPPGSAAWPGRRWSR